MKNKVQNLVSRFFILLITSTAFATGISGQPVHRSIKWKELLAKRTGATQSEKVPWFEGAFYDGCEVPQYLERFPLDNASSHVSASLSGLQFELLNDGSQIKDGSKICKDINVKTEIVIMKRKAFAQVTFIPIRKSSEGSYERLVAFKLSITQTQGASKRVATTYYTSNSVLAAGNWFKIGVTNDGICKLTYQNLKDLGMDVDGLNPQNLRIYGNGGAMLPFANSAQHDDDLQENAIYVQGGYDGRFHKTDYVLFYGQNPNRWSYNATDGHYHHQVNWYSDTTYYFITADLGSGKRIQQQASTAVPATATVNTFDDYAYHELDAVNWLKSGRQWFGETFDEINNTHSFQFNFPNHVDSFYLKSDVWARSLGYPCSFDLSVNSNKLLNEAIPLTPTQDFSAYAEPCSTAVAISFVSGDKLTVTLKFNPSAGNPSGQGWLNFLEVNVHRKLIMPSALNQFQFRNVEATGVGKIADYNLSGSTSLTQVWEITDPLNVSNIIAASNTGGVFEFRLPADSIREFIAFNGAAFYSAALVGKVENQNLHALPQTDMVIVAHPNFMNAAMRLAQFHRTNDNLSVQIVTPQQVYNEFSSGKQDVSAIRNFMKMFYDRALDYGHLPQTLLLFGRGSFDPKNRVGNNTDYIVCYESANSNLPTGSYMSDDFFAFLDSNEGDWDSGVTNLMDISVGRLPVKSASEADAIVDKIIHYATPGPSTSGQVCNSTSGTGGSFGDWRNVLAFVADDQDENAHFIQSEGIDVVVGNTYKDYNIDKIYIDSYKQEVTPGGDRYPAAQAAIVDRVQRGALMVNYIGHGGPLGWAAERILEDGDINGWTNYDRLPAFMTATCEFSTADDPTITSAGELVLLNAHGGGIALFTTCRLAESMPNYILGQRFWGNIFNPVNGRMPRIGEITMLTKNEYPDPATHNFLLLGDPALTLAYPKMSVRTTLVDGKSVNSAYKADTLRALQKVTISGYISKSDNDTSKMTGYNGVIYPTVYDKAETYHTLANDNFNNSPSDYSMVAPFQLQNSILYKGAATVTNGNFTFTFVVPKDISYQYGLGRLSYYADNQATDASGYFDNIIIGGINTNAPVYTKGPAVKLYMNDTTFAPGGLTDQGPSLYAKITDSSGVSTVGNGIGHDITAQLDNDNSKIYVLNDYYQADLNSYQSGKVIYAFAGLTERPHFVVFKVWNVYNISTEARLDFVVASSSKLTLTHVLNYPNPFTTGTKFFFEHNKPCMPLVVQIQVYTVSGRLIKTIRNDTECDGYRSNSITWDGLDDFGDRIGRGVYVYRLKVHAADGSEAEKYEKLVVLR